MVYCLGGAYSRASIPQLRLILGLRLSDYYKNKTFKATNFLSSILIGIWLFVHQPSHFYIYSVSIIINHLIYNMIVFFLFYLSNILEILIMFRINKLLFRLTNVEPHMREINSLGINTRNLQFNLTYLLIFKT